jgi:hypothetical protein
MAPPRPMFQIMWHHFVTIYGDGSLRSVGEKIGGKVQENLVLGETDPVNGFTNACAIRMSYCLNYSGAPIRRGNWATSSGADKKWYLYRVSDLVSYLTQTFGKPDKTVKNPTPGDFSNMKGLLIFRVQFTDATGHASLWNGAICSDHCYFPRAMEASIWLLK